MRNILEYPITSDEVIWSLNEAIADFMGKNEIGSVNGLCLEYVKDYLTRNGNFDDWLREVQDLG